MKKKGDEESPQQVIPGTVGVEELVDSWGGRGRGRGKKTYLDL